MEDGRFMPEQLHRIHSERSAQSDGCREQQPAPNTSTLRKQEMAQWSDAKQTNNCERHVSKNKNRCFNNYGDIDRVRSVHQLNRLGNRERPCCKQRGFQRGSNSAEDIHNALNAKLSRA